MRPFRFLLVLYSLIYRLSTSKPKPLSAPLLPPFSAILPRLSSPIRLFYRSRANYARYPKLARLSKANFLFARFLVPPSFFSGHKSLELPKNFRFSRPFLNLRPQGENWDLFFFLPAVNE